MHEITSFHHEQQLDLEGLAIQKLLSRNEWTAACHFHSLDSNAILEEVARRVSKTPNALVLLDLDSTLYEVAPRNLQIFTEWANSNSNSELKEIQIAILQSTLKHIGFSVQDTLQLLQVQNHPQWNEALDSIRKFWFKRFFTNEYLQYDAPYPGAVEFTKKLHLLGAEIVYLTGRDAPNMGDGTRANLIRDGFPWNVPKTRLLMKPATHIKDIEFKTAAVASLQNQGTLVASLENEPPNLVAIHQLFPEAMHIFVDTVCSENGALPRQGLYRLKWFSL